MPQLTRNHLTFSSGSVQCAAWFYPGTNGACIVMATGAGVIKEPGTDRFAARFQAAGYAVLAFDFRRFGGSGGTPRQVLRIRDQVADLQAAIAFATTLPNVDPGRVVAWGFSLGGGHVLQAAPDLPIAAAIVQTPFADGFAATPNALRHETLGVVLRFPLIALRDVARGLMGRAPLLVPLEGLRGTVAMLTTPDAQDAAAALDPEGAYPDWVQAVAARSVMSLGFYRPGRRASQITCPLLVVVAESDQSVLAAPARTVAEQAPNAELVCVDGGHYAPFLDAHDRVVQAELAFLDTHVVGAGPNRAGQ
jgi:pimeloyl-ACP methyl ester carboxylesterase